MTDAGMKKEGGGQTADTTINSDLTADFLVSNYGYRISWTHNLAEHLQIDYQRRDIKVYEHKICLYNHMRFADEGETVIPQDVLEEAIDTLNQLFPFQHDATARILKKHRKPFYELGFCKRARQLDLEGYHYWRGKVADLVEIARQPPVGIKQLVLDRDGKNLLSFANFWIAVAVGVLAAMSIAFGAVATVYAVKQYDLALLQYELSVAQACLDESTKTQLPKFCSS